MPASPQLPFPSYYIENTTRNGFVSNEIERGHSIPFFSTPEKAEEYKRLRGYSTCRTMVLPDVEQLGKLLDVLPPAVTHIVVDMGYDETIDQHCINVPALRAMVPAIKQRLQDVNG